MRLNEICKSEGIKLITQFISESVGDIPIEISNNGLTKKETVSS